ncbi:Synaptic glycoprotein SC2 [Entamoeba marina]
MTSVNYKNNNYKIDIDLSKTVREFREVVEKETGLKACQQRLWFEKDGSKVVLEVDKTLAESGVTADSKIEMKNLGPQLPFRQVYILEYIGPLALYFLSYVIARLSGRELFFQHHLANAMWVIHYIKRIVETIYVHEFGDMTMPVFNLYKNCTYYWGFAVLVGINVNFFTSQNNSFFIFVGFVGMVASIICNGYCHWILKQLRTPGSQEWKQPNGFLFEYVTCPNYFCEIMTWVFFNIMTGFPLLGIAFSCADIRNITPSSRIIPKSRKILVPFIY